MFTVYVDMDGVLVNMYPAACGYFKIPIINEHRIGSHFDQRWTSPQGWPQLREDWPSFWADIPPMPCAFDLWKLLRDYHPSILTAIPSGWTEAEQGKAQWITKHLPKFGYHPSQMLHVVQRIQKKNYALQENGTPNILIDDFDKNINDWCEAGGIGILYNESPDTFRIIEETLQNLTMIGGS